MMFLSTEPGSQYNWIFTNKLDYNQSHVGTSHREMDTGHFSIGFLVVKNLEDPRLESFLIS